MLPLVCTATRQPCCWPGVRLKWPRAMRQHITSLSFAATPPTFSSHHHQYSVRGREPPASSHSCHLQLQTHTLPPQAPTNGDNPVTPCNSSPQPSPPQQSCSSPGTQPHGTVPSPPPCRRAAALRRRPALPRWRRHVGLGEHVEHHERASSNEQPVLLEPRALVGRRSGGGGAAALLPAGAAARASGGSGGGSGGAGAGVGVQGLRSKAAKVAEVGGDLCMVNGQRYDGSTVKI